MLRQTWTRRLSQLLVISAYAGALLFSYHEVESVIFEYQGIRWNPPSTGLVAAAFAGLGILGLLGPTNLRRPSSLIYWMSLVTVTCPVALFAFHTVSGSAAEIAPIVATMMGCQVLLLLAGSGQAAPLSLPRVRQELVTTFLLAATTLCFATIITRSGFSWSFDIVDVYTRRLAARDAAPEATFASYVIAASGSAIGPIAFVFGVVRRRWLVAISGFAVLLAIFAFSGAKTSLFTPLFFLALLKVGDNTARRLPVVLVSGFGMMVLLGWWTFEATGDLTISEAYTRRLIVSKGVSTGQYWEAFRDTPYWFRDSGLVRLLGMTPQTGKSFVIGELYGFGAEENANANAWIAMYANVGVAGLILVSLVLVALARWLDRLAAVADEAFVRAYSGFVVFIIGETALETSVLNGGLLLGLLVVTAAVASARTAQERDARP